MVRKLYKREPGPNCRGLTTIKHYRGISGVAVLLYRTQAGTQTAYAVVGSADIYKTILWHHKRFCQEASGFKKDFKVANRVGDLEFLFWVSECEKHEISDRILYARNHYGIKEDLPVNPS